MYQNILVINTMHIGDLMLITPALRTLRTNYPQAHIALLTDRPLGDLVRCNKNIDECILIDKRGRDKGILALLRLIRKIRGRHFDLVINFHRNERASAIAAFSGGKHIVGYSQPGFKRFFNKVMPNRAMADTPKELAEHQVVCHWKCCGRLPVARSWMIAVLKCGCRRKKKKKPPLCGKRNLLQG